MDHSLKNWAVPKLLLISAIWLGTGATQVDTFDFPSTEARDRFTQLISELRCPKCQNINLTGSDAPIAMDLRTTVHRLIVEGKNDDEIREFLQSRYGDFILYDPPFKPSTWLLWLFPVVLLGIGVFVVLRVGRRPETVSIDEAERNRLNEIKQG